MKKALTRFQLYMKKSSVLQPTDTADAVLDIEAAREAAAQRELMKRRLRLLPPPVSADLPAAA
jgi:hypothetical protein